MAENRITAFKRYILILLGYYGIRAYLSTIRLRVLNEEALKDHLDSGGKAVAAFWHQRIFGVISYAERFKKYSPSAIISKSSDGELIAQVVIRLGIRPVRGSSSRGGREALASVVEDLLTNNFVVHAVDGPRGPTREVKAGLIRMAQLSNAAIFPVYISADRAWTVKSWDRFIIPKPFSRIFIHWDNPIFVPREMDDAAFESLRLDIEERMTRGYARGDLDLGWECPL